MDDADAVSTVTHATREPVASRERVCLRVLGFWKSVPFSAVHRILPLGFVGVIMNVFTGMLMMLADTYRYVVNDYTFAPKIALPATKVSAPASHTDLIVLRSIPPSTSRNALLRPVRHISLRVGKAYIPSHGGRRISFRCGHS